MRSKEFLTSKSLTAAKKIIQINDGVKINIKPLCDHSFRITASLSNGFF